MLPRRWCAHPPPAPLRHALHPSAASPGEPPLQVDAEHIERNQPPQPEQPQRGDAARGARVAGPLVYGPGGSAAIGPLLGPVPPSGQPQATTGGERHSSRVHASPEVQRGEFSGQGVLQPRDPPTRSIDFATEHDIPLLAEAEDGDACGPNPNTACAFGGPSAHSAPSPAVRELTLSVRALPGERSSQPGPGARLPRDSRAAPGAAAAALAAPSAIGHPPAARAGGAAACAGPRGCRAPGAAGDHRAASAAAQPARAGAALWDVGAAPRAASAGAARPAAAPRATSAGAPPAAAPPGAAHPPAGGAAAPLPLPQAKRVRGQGKCVFKGCHGFKLECRASKQHFLNCVRLDGCTGCHQCYC